jgi:hypothetical protein
MTDMATQDLNGVAETLLITLYIRAMESRRPDALLRDSKAEELVTRMANGFDRIRQLKIDENSTAWPGNLFPAIPTPSSSISAVAWIPVSNAWTTARSSGSISMCPR